MTFLLHILAYATAKGHTLIDRELYLPMDWIEDRERRQAASIPESVRFQTKPELAVQMLERIFQAAVPIAWVVADTVYGGNLDLRTWLEAHQYPYALAVACDSAGRLPDAGGPPTRRSCVGRSVGAGRTGLATPLDE